MQTWPSSFPDPDISFQVDVSANTIRTDIDTGVIRQRRRFSEELVTVSVEWEMSDVEFSVFVAFHKFKLNLGSDWFQINLYLGGGYQTTIARFQGGQYVQAYEDVGFWKVTAKLDIQNRFTLDEATLEIYLGIGFDDAELQALIDSISGFDTFVQHTAFTNLN